MRKKTASPADLKDSMVLVGIGIAAVYWFIDILLQIFSSDRQTFVQLLSGQDSKEFLTRLVVLCLFLIFGSHVQYTINNRKRMEQALLASYEDTQKAKGAAILSLAKLAEFRDKETGAHLERIREYVKIIAEELAKNPKYQGIITAKYINDLYHSAILHDIGKVGIPDAILLKAGELTPEEFEIVKDHTTIGGNALEGIDARIKDHSFLRLGKEIAYHHHEKWDGTGYPASLKGDEIPAAARHIALADVYDALTSKRTYKDPLSHERAKAYIVGEKGRQFDPDVVEAFLARAADFDIVRQKMQDDLTGQ